MRATVNGTTLTAQLGSAPLTTKKKDHQKTESEYGSNAARRVQTIVEVNNNSVFWQPGPGDVWQHFFAPNAPPSNRTITVIETVPRLPSLTDHTALSLLG